MPELRAGAVDASEVRIHGLLSPGTHWDGRLILFGHDWLVFLGDGDGGGVKLGRCHGGVTGGNVAAQSEYVDQRVFKFQD